MPTEMNTARPEKNSERGQRNARKPFKKREPKEFDSVVVSINRVSKTTKGGRTMRFSALVVVGDHKGRIGFGMGKATEVPDAIRKAEEAANKNVFRVNLVEGTRTVPHAVKKTANANINLRKENFIKLNSKVLQLKTIHQIHYSDNKTVNFLLQKQNNRLAFHVLKLHTLWN